MQDNDEAEDEDSPPPPPTAFGLPAEPVGCGLVGGLLFAALMAPLFFNAPGSASCIHVGGDCVPVGDDLRVGLAGSAILALAFGVATAALARGRVRAWRERRSARPPLWVGFVALFLVGGTLVGLALVPLQLLLQRLLG